MMLYDLLMLATKSEIDKGLLNGQYTRWGGTIRVSKGYPGAGQIVGMLRDASPDGDMRLITNANGHYNMQPLNQVMGMASSIGAAASVINLGVSAAGFYIMNNKLKKLQKSVSQMQQITEAGFERLDERFDKIQGQLVELKIFHLETREYLQDLYAGVYDIKYALFTDKMATIDVAMQRIGEIQHVNDHESKKYIDDFSRVRLSFQGELEGRSLNINDHPKRFLDSMMLYRGWGIAGAGEVYARRKLGELERPSKLASELACQSRSWSKQWANDLLPIGEYGGVNRFGHSKFRSRISDAQRVRLFRVYTGDDLSDGEIRQLEIDGAERVAHKIPDLGGDSWFQRQHGIADTLDMIEETTERLESLEFETKLCAKNRLNFDKWENAGALQA